MSRATRTCRGPGVRRPGTLPAIVRTLAAAIALVASAACGSGGVTAAPASAAPATAAAPSGPVAGTLRGVVGTADSPDAYEITLLDSAGRPVTRLAAGTYAIAVEDRSRLHNFHLTGPGVDSATPVAGLQTTTWTVALSPGTYRFRCDPHPNMRGSFTVAG